MLSEKQLNSIHRLPKDDILAVMHECAEALGCVSVPNYCEIVMTGRRTVYQHITEGKINVFEIDGHKFPLINF